MVKIARKKRTVKRKVYKKKRMVTMGKTLRVPFPDHFDTTLSFYNALRVGNTTSSSYLQQYRLNSMYDMNYTSTTGGDMNNQQPFYYDQLMAIYGYYAVTKVDFQVKAVGDRSFHLVINSVPNSSAVPSAVNIVDSLQRPGALKGFYGIGGSPLILKKSYSMAKVFGVTKERIIEDPGYSGQDAVTSVLNVAYLNMSFWPGDQNTSTGFDCVVKMRVHVRLYNRKEVALS